jgi:hypothetical protein
MGRRRLARPQEDALMSAHVLDGTYTGGGNRSLDFHGKALVLRSQNGPQNCVIDPNRQSPAVYFHSGKAAAS